MDVVTGIVVAAVTAVVVVGALVTTGFVMLFRRRGDVAVRPSGPNTLEALGKRASALLVHMDDAVREADEELGYAIDHICSHFTSKLQGFHLSKP